MSDLVCLLFGAAPKVARLVSVNLGDAVEMRTAWTTSGGIPCIVTQFMARVCESEAAYARLKLEHEELKD